MIEINNLDKYFNKGKPGEVHAVRDLNLIIADKEYVVIIGSNGSGKSTLLNLVAGSEFATNGSIRFDGTIVDRLPDYKRSRFIARVFQNPLSGTAPELTILDNFRLASLRTRPKQMSIGINARFRERVSEQVRTLGMGLENKLLQPIGSLSGGQRQALTLLMSVMDNTKVLLLDEPTAALDPKSAALVMDTAQKIIEERKLIALLITHNLKDARQYGNRLIQMAEGAIANDIPSNAKQSLSLQEMVHWFN